MNFITRVHTQYLSWARDTPLPSDLDTTPIFQAWNRFDASANRWITVSDDDTAGDALRAPSKDSSLVLVTWNVDSASAVPEARISSIISHIRDLTRPADVLFFQEVSPAALTTLLEHPWIRESWFSSERDETNWKGQSFASMTLLSKSRFGHGNGLSVGKAMIGPVWRVKYPSRFGRDALCCDLFLPSVGPGIPKAHTSASTIRTSATGQRVRLVNVHLDSLPIHSSLRPRQVSIISSLIRSAGRGLVAGDFNPVLPEDDTLISENHMVDAWAELHSQEPGFTWGVDGDQPFPPNRLDKVALVGLKVEDIEIMHPEAISYSDSSLSVESHGDKEIASDAQGKQDGIKDQIPWSDHSGLKCTFSHVED